MSLIKRFITSYPIFFSTHYGDPSPTLKTAQNAGIGLIHVGRGDALQIDARGLLRVVAQGLADDGKGDLSVAGDGSPGVAGDIEGQRTGKADGAGDLAQVVADACLGVVVLLII